MFNKSSFTIIVLLILSLSACSKSEAKIQIELLKSTQNTAQLNFTPSDMSKQYAVFISLKEFDTKTMTSDINGMKSLLDAFGLNSDTQRITINNLNDATKTGNSNSLIYLGKSRDKMELNDLSPKTKYYLDAFYVTETELIPAGSMYFTTMSDKVLTQTSNISFALKGTNKYSIKFNEGNGDGRILVAASKQISDFPKNGKIYTSGEYGSQIAKLNNENAYVVYDTEQNSDNENIEITIDSEDPFWLYVFEYQGNGEARQYNIEQADGNPREIMPGLPAPVATDAVEYPDGFIAKWRGVDGAEKYLVDVAYDENFSDMLPNYDATDFGLTTELPVIVKEPKSNTLYYRIRAVGSGKISGYSNVVTVKIK